MIPLLMLLTTCCLSWFKNWFQCCKNTCFKKNSVDPEKINSHNTNKKSNKDNINNKSSKNAADVDIDINDSKNIKEDAKDNSTKIEINVKNEISVNDSKKDE